jgi:amino acid transporter
MVVAMAQQELKRQIGLFDSVMLISGDMIGIGIFVTTGVIAETLPTPGGVLLVWFLGGLLALTGALSCAELSASLPYAGGDYIYIREAYGKLVGFLSGWSSFLVTFSGAIAFLAVGFNGFMSFFFPILGSKEAIFYLDDSEDRISVGNCSLGRLIRQRRHGAFQPIIRLAENHQFQCFCGGVHTGDFCLFGMERGDLYRRRGQRTGAKSAPRFVMGKPDSHRALPSG